MDPRRPGYNPDYAAKRKPSRSPPGGVTTKMQRTGNGSDAADAPTSGRPAPPALMTVAPMPADSLVDMLMAFGNQCSKVASTHVIQNQAQMALDRANAEYRKMSEHFQTFPQIREQKTAAKNKAEKSLKAATTDLDQHREAQKQLATSIATLVAKAQPAVGAASAADLQHVEQKCNAIEKKLDDSNNSFSAADRQRIEIKFKDLEQQVGHLNNVIKDHQSFEGQIKDLTLRYTQLDKDLKATHNSSAADKQCVKDKCKDLEQQVAILTMHTQLDKDLKATHNSSAADKQCIKDKCKDLEQQVGHLNNVIKDHQSLEGQIKDLTRRYTQLEKDLKAVDSRLSSLQDHVAGDSGDSLQAKLLALTVQTSQIKTTSNMNETTNTCSSQTIEARFQHERDLARDENEKRDQAIAQYVEDGIKGVKEDREAVLQQITAMSQARAQDVAQVNALRNDILADMSTIKNRLVTMESKTEDYESVKSTVGDHVQEISKLKGEISTKADKEFVAGAMQNEDYESVKSTVGNHAQEISKLKGEVSNKADKEFVASAMQKVTREQHAVQPSSGPPTPGMVLPGSSNGSMPPQTNGIHPQGSLNPSGQPRVGSFSNPSSFDAEKRITELQQQTDILSYVTQRLQTQYNNLTTESVCQAMLDQLGEVWPHAKNWEGWINELKARQAEFDRQKEEMQGQVAKLALDAGMALEAAKEARNFSAATTRITSEAESRSEQQAKACQTIRQELDGVSKRLSELESQGRKELLELSGRVSTIVTEIGKVKGTFEAWEENRG
ncbi:hypothetical protein Tdes44962_MAKER00214 [Teratosphaeria destructans]|uniref:Uncharacterized protein n=1 Tax=Teratosphaeria destructans TaxID=418781 RepID=A0A9W7SVI6_9PEZI|nr:hypothetical protein Tdes44962_MAKER00214 [Teratosphaeria destructans]